MKIYFLSDLHLGAPYFEDSKKTEKRVVSFLDSIKNDADQIYLLGDILDYWYEYRYVVPRGFVRFFGKLAELSDSGIKITWLIGNHDIWIFDYLPNELGIRVIDGSVVEQFDGKTFFLSHGDGIGKLKPSFKIIRSVFRSHLCQKLFSAIHPRWTVPFAYKWSSHSRKHQGPSDADAENMLSSIKEFSINYHKSNPKVDTFIFGHLHLLRDLVVAPDCRLVVLGEWIKTFSYAVWDGQELKLKVYQSQ